MFRHRPRWMLVSSPLLLVWSLAFAEPDIQRLDRDGVQVVYAAPVTESMASSVADLVMLSKQRTLAYLRQSAAYPDDRADVRIRVLIDPDAASPSQMRTTIFLPQSRVLAFFDPEQTGTVSLAITHEVTHVLAISAYRINRNRFLDDGLAVFLQAELDDLPAYPNFHRGLHIATADTALERGALIELEQTENMRKEPGNGIDLKMAYLQEGSFTQFLIETFGLDAYLKHYYGDSTDVAFGTSIAELDADWVALIKSLLARPQTESINGSTM